MIKLLNPYAPITYEDEMRPVLMYMIPIVCTLVFWIFAVNAKSVQLDAAGITIRFFLFPFFSFRYIWDDFEYYVLVVEGNGYRESRSIWLVKNKRLKLRFREDFYTNFSELRTALKTPNAGLRHFDQATILKATFGFSVGV
jgi:hypothetical protein